MTIKQVFDITNNQLIITLPESFKNKKKVMVTIEDSLESKADKINLIKLAAKDPLFLQDIKEVNIDFSMIDSETL